MSQRLARVNELLKREIAEDLFRLRPRDFEIGALTVTRVDVSPNLRHAAVYVSVFGYEDRRAQIISYLNNNHAAIQQMVCKRVKLKYTPKLVFKCDTSLEQGDHVLTLLNELEENPPGNNEDDAKL